MNNKSLTEKHQKRLESLSCYLKELRLAEGMTQAEVANEINLHRNTIVRVENSKNISLVSLFILCDHYCISIHEIFQDIK